MGFFNLGDLDLGKAFEDSTLGTIKDTFNFGKDLVTDPSHAFGNHQRSMTKKLGHLGFDEDNKMIKNSDAIAAAVVGSIFAAPVMAGSAAATGTGTGAGAGAGGTLATTAPAAATSTATTAAAAPTAATTAATPAATSPVATAPTAAPAATPSTPAPSSTATSRWKDPDTYRRMAQRMGHQQQQQKQQQQQQLQQQMQMSQQQYQQQHQQPQQRSSIFGDLGTQRNSRWEM